MAVSSKRLEASFDVFSPRWGHTDRYTVALTHEEMRLSQGSNSATCRAASNGDPEWAGYGSAGENPVMAIFSNDSIYAPLIVPSALEWAWERWRDGEASDEEVREGLGQLFAWIDQTARGKPTSALFRGAF